MPINVQHGVPASAGVAALAQTAMRIRAQKEAAALAAVSRGGGGGGRSGGGGQTNRAQQQYDLAAQQAQYREEAAEKGQEYEIAGRQQEAQLEMEGLEFEYTTKQRTQMAQWTNALNDLSNDPNLSPGEQETMAFQLKQRIAGIQKTATLADANKPSYAGTEKDVGLTWPGDNGGVYTRNGDGSVRELTEPSKTERGIERAAEIKQQESDSKFLDSLGSMLVDDPDSRDGGKKSLSDDMIDKMVLARERGRRTMEKSRAVTDDGLDRGPDVDWVDWTEKTMGIKLTTEEVNLGEEVGRASALVRELSKAWGSIDQMPPRAREIFLQAAEVVSNSGA